MGRKSKGRRIDPAGYIVVSGGRHGQREHRLVAEQALGRPLLSTEDVHHENEVKTDNRPENLTITSHADHTRIHHPKQLIAAACGYCGTALKVQPYKLRYSKSGKVF